jgi:hypothetical protein
LDESFFIKGRRNYANPHGNGNRQGCAGKLLNAGTRGSLALKTASAGSIFPRSMKSTLCSLAVLLLAAANVLQAADARTDAGWTPLFDGKTLDGWVQRGGKAKYRIEDGVLIGTCVPNTPNSFLCTAREFTNFIFEIEFSP